MNRPELQKCKPIQITWSKEHYDFINKNIRNYPNPEEFYKVFKQQFDMKLPTMNGIEYIQTKKNGKTKKMRYKDYMWMVHYSEIPENHRVINLNGDKTDCRIENLECIPSNIAISITATNRIHSDPELTKVEIKIVETLQFVKDIANEFDLPYRGIGQTIATNN
jgi:hypothetical protein